MYQTGRYVPHAHIFSEEQRKIKVSMNGSLLQTAMVYRAADFLETEMFCCNWFDQLLNSVKSTQDDSKRKKGIYIYILFYILRKKLKKG
jgi:hypothetical protein